MGTTDTRLTKNYRVKANVIRTPLYSDESISSWLIRAALDCGTTPLTFTGFYWEKYRLWTMDLDRGLESIDPTIYADITTLSLNGKVKLAPHSLYHQLHPIHGKTVFNRGSVKWLIPRSVRNRTHNIGQAYCPCCLAEEPYLRTQWRLAWQFGCIKHNVQLETACPKCNARFQPHLLSADKRTLAHCHECGTVLSGSNTLRLLNATEQRTQHTIEQFYTTHQGLFLGKSIDSTMWFSTLRYFINLLRRAAMTKESHSFAQFVMALGINLDDVPCSQTGLTFELLPVSERMKLLVNACTLISLDMACFVQALKQSGITQKALAFDVYPSSLLPIVEQAPVGEIRTPRKHKTNIMPQTESNLAVSRRWERLKRQMNL